MKLQFVAFVIVAVVAGWSLYENHRLLTKYTKLQDKHAVAMGDLALKKSCKE